MNFISAFSELDRLYESVESGLSEKEIKYIDFLCDELSRLPKNPSTSAVEALFKDVPEKVFAITVADIEAVADQCEYQEQVVAAVATMNEKGLKTIGDLAKSLKEVKESLTEAADEEDVVEDETAEEAEEEIGEEVVNKPIVLECVKCGALVIKDESEVTIDEESNLANVGEECTYCEESEGFKAIGTFEPYVVETTEEEAEDVIESLNEGLEAKVKSVLEPFVALGKLRVLTNDEKRKLPQSFEIEPETAKNGVVYFQGKPFNYSVDGDDLVVTAGGLNNDLEEGIFDRKKKSSKKAAGSANNDDVKREVNFKVYDQNGTLKFNRDFTELPGKMNADDQFKHAFKEMSVYNEYRNSTGKRDWSFERVSNPPSPAFDTKRGRTKFLSMDMHLEDLDSPDGDLEELFDISPNVSLSLSGGTGNDVDVL